ncbi:MAG: two pore domain potassium channel family protein [Bacteroidales bacterium]|nr:two pore domain potassium channel family protein [Bacteroidales bacterium]MBD5282254.1 two pore domain potassium channel family protein [Bacteroides sp.]MDE6262224.1 potassium channel family protein [Muribaculaceae bacterium]MBD5293708.1 two pore domain potassium channel family protein [Bacteroides sp.]MBD5341659.1 two pore domain potassium channel family protein [Bacteroides sp.]
MTQTQTNTPQTHLSRAQAFKSDLRRLFNFLVMVLSAAMIIWISYDTFNKRDLLQDHGYMTFQFWVCITFIIDFIIVVLTSDQKMKTFRSHLFFLILSIPYLNIINQLNIHLSPDAIYFIRFIPLARGALAMSIVIGYLSSNAVSSLFIRYLTIMLLTAYFCSLIFFQREYGINPQVTGYSDALWFCAMNLVTVGCNISPVTAAGKIVAVVLPITGMIIFPLFTVYLTDYVTRNQKNKE